MRWAPGLKVKVREPLGCPWAPGVKVKVRERPRKCEKEGSRKVEKVRESVKSVKKFEKVRNSMKKDYKVANGS